jgi:hypothetical protein
VDGSLAPGFLQASDACLQIPQLPEAGRHRDRLGISEQREAVPPDAALPIIGLNTIEPFSP